MNKREAQERIKRVFAFRDELLVLQVENIVHLSNEDQNAISTYHDKLLEGYSRRYDTDLSKSELQLSWGMRITSTLGAIAFALGFFLFFEYYWDFFSTTVQVVLLTVAPFLGWALCEVVAKRYNTSHYTSLAALVAITCFVADLYIVGAVFNITPSPNAFLVWGIFGLILAYRHDLAIVMGLSLISIMQFFGGFFTILAGFSWPTAQILEFYLLTSSLFLAVTVVIKFDVVTRYRYVYYFVGLFQTYCVLMWLMCCPSGSLLPFATVAIEWIYMVIGFIVGGATICQCIRKEWAVGTFLSTVFLVVFMLHKYFDWFWEDLPHYVFFLVLGVIAVAIIASLRKMRDILRGASDERI